MIEKLLWTRYAPYLDIEWQQAIDEGKDVYYLESACKEIAKKASDLTIDLEDEAMTLRKLLEAPINSKYIEPSDYEEILKQRPSKKVSLKKANKETLHNKIYGAWQGRVSGCLLGCPIEGMKLKDINEILKNSNNYPLNRYITEKELSKEDYKKLPFPEKLVDKLGGKSPIDDDINYLAFALKLVETYGKDFKRENVIEGWLNWVPYLTCCTAERVVYRNYLNGMPADENTVVYQNPYKEWIGAQIRGDFFGYINPGNPEAAAKMAYKDASISHIKNGIYGEMLIAAMISAAAVCDDINTIIDAGLGEIPENCRLSEDIALVRKWCSELKDFNKVILKIHEKYDEYSQHWWCHTNSNAMICIASLIFSDNSFDKAILNAVSSAFDTDCNGATVGSIIGMIVGADNISSKWTSIFNDNLSSAVMTMGEIDLKDAVNRTLKLID